MNDYLVRATAADDRIRAFAATTRDLTEEARARHNSSPIITAALGRLMTAALMMGTMLKSEGEKLTLKLEGDGPAHNIIAIADNTGGVKGYAGDHSVLLPPNAKGKLDVAGAVGKGVLRVTRSDARGEPFTGTCELVSGEIAEDLTYYFATSEQTPSGVGLGVLMNKDNTVRCAGGFIVQVMPGITDEELEMLEQRLGSIASVTSMLNDGMTPEDMLRYILPDPTFHEKRELRYHCGCSRESVEGVLLSLGRKELTSLADRPVEVHCDFCESDYVFTQEEVLELLGRTNNA
ncbi:MAG: Hsp33 family molecular chaperone HslO [Ruminococcaceae bacterium]|nr:Hsp33 family molecular chaperone HslO [Oscillospiraceae bacterium]